MIKELLKKENLLHIAIILLGTILILIPAFHSNIWFDESYSVAISNHSFSEIWTIGGNDVHPILYYWMLKIINILFGSNIIIYRIFSVLGIVGLGILGFTHIKKDFGTKTGLLFTFFSFFLPVMLNYALEIRMYSWSIFFVTLMVIYLNRFIKDFILVEALQVILYIPWMFYFIKQLTRVGGGFWIRIEFPQILIDIINFQFKGSLEQIIPTIFASILLIYILYIIIKNIKKKENIKEGIIPIIIYILVIAIAAIASLKSPILYARYLFPISGLLIFSICYFLAKENKTFIIGMICGSILIMSVMNLKENIEENYDISNDEPFAYLEENLQPEDIIVYTSINNGGVVAALIDSNQQYFLNVDNWTIEEAYKAYAPQMKVAYSFEEAMKEAKGRIFIIDDGSLSCYNRLENKEEYKQVEIKKFEPKYKEYTYQIVVLEKIK